MCGQVIFENLEQLEHIPVTIQLRGYEKRYANKIGQLRADLVVFFFIFCFNKNKKLFLRENRALFSLLFFFSSSLGTRKRLFFIPSCLPVHFESRKTHWRLLWEESVLKKEKEILLRQECKQTKRVIETRIFVVFVIPVGLHRLNMESWEQRTLRNDWILWVLMGKYWPSTNMERQLML